MVVDLYQCMLERERKYFTIIDGIVGGEGQGPFCPNTKESKVILASDDLLVGDIVATRLMGFDPEKIKYINYFMDLNGLRFDDIEVMSNIFDSKNFFINIVLFVFISDACGSFISNNWLNLGPMTIPAIILAKLSNFSL